MGSAGAGGALIGRFLIDECLTPALVAAAKARSFEADHVTHIGKAGWQDWNLVRFAVANDYVVVTNNRRDFLKGIRQARRSWRTDRADFVRGARAADRFVLKVLDVLGSRNDDLVNTLVEVLADGTVHLTEWSSNNADADHIDDPYGC
ncbi:MAG: DUF5615 family PIN-like protein [Tardiphaga sp.]